MDSYAGTAADVEDEAGACVEAAWECVSEGVS